MMDSKYFKCLMHFSSRQFSVSFPLCILDMSCIFFFPSFGPDHSASLQSSGLDRFSS